MPAPLPPLCLFAPMQLAGLLQQSTAHRRAALGASGAGGGSGRWCVLDGIPLKESQNAQRSKLLPTRGHYDHCCSSLVGFNSNGDWPV
eukprot:CAMPEP_0171107220 /NCGR_PEP_ID=MMETSP0766_2-20121228/66373_1 /TAXON_ID=439317 /ORGANISM="Gambierdiscus australes, Strain CAWD 149" /LENGTH=87 /DNA_ID=CAMNT_0011568475 /DNA_START=112 /DNA_END=372 /DNA_ORIENTATION=-